MYYTDGKLQYPVRVDNPDPRFARYLQQAIGGVEGEIRVAMQYFFQGWATADPKYRDMLLSTATEEIAHIEMVATAVALNLEGAPTSLQDEAVQQDPAVAAILGGMSAKQYLSAGLHAMPVDSDGVPFDMSNVYASGNIGGDMLANATAESTGRTLATRLYNMTDDPGMKDMLSFLIGRDTMHQQQWLAVIEELGGYEGVLPIPNSFPQEEENSISTPASAMTCSRLRVASPVGRRSTARASSPTSSPYRRARYRSLRLLPQAPTRRRPSWRAMATPHPRRRNLRAVA